MISSFFKFPLFLLLEIEHLTNGLISEFAVCAMLLNVCEKLLEATCNRIYHNLETACN